MVTGRPSQPMFLLDHAYLLQPGYSLLLAPWLKLFGVGLLQARLLAVLFGLATLWCVYSLARDLFDEQVGLVAAMFLATDSNFLGVSRFARTDGPAVLFSVLALALFVRARKNGRLIPLFGAGAAAGAAMLCHLNCYWVVIVLGVWHLMVFGRRMVWPAVVSSLGFFCTFGPYLAVVLTRREEFNAQLNQFAIERVPSLDVLTILRQAAHETERYRDWYFGLITDFTFNPLLRIFQLCTALGVVWLIAAVARGLATGTRRRSEELLASAVLLTVAIFALFIPNKALVYLPHLLIGFSLAAGYFVVQATAGLTGRVRASGWTFAAPVTACLLLEGAGAFLLYGYWYYQMRSALTPYGETDRALKLLVPKGPKYLIGSPTFWLAFYDDPQTKFVAYTAAGPFKNIKPMGFFTRVSLFNLPQDRPYYVLVDDNEWKTILNDPGYDAEWRATWLDYIRNSCSLSGAVPRTAHGTIALYRCWNDGKPEAQEPIYVAEAHRYRKGESTWVGTPQTLSDWSHYTSGTTVTRTAGALRVSGQGAGIYGDVRVEPGVSYVVETDVDRARPGDWLALYPVLSDGRLGRGRWISLTASSWFPTGTIVMQSQPMLRLYVYSDSATDFSVRSVRVSRLVDETAATIRP
jgi:hypothetical protein